VSSISASRKALLVGIAFQSCLAFSASMVRATEGPIVAVLGYTPNKAAAAVAAIVYFICGLAFFYRVFRIRNWWALCLPIGSTAMAFGFVIRVLLNNPSHQQHGPFIAEEILTSCSPAAFLAFNYIVYGRLLRSFIGRRHSLLPPNYIATFFVCSDVLTFFVQAAGAAMFTNISTLNTGKKVFQIGVILQSASYYIFYIMLFMTWRSIRKEGIATGREMWWKAYKMVAISSLFIVVRTIFRIIYSSTNKDSKVRTDEVFLYVFDTIPLFLAIVGYIFKWPGVYMTGDSIADSNRTTLLGLEKLGTSSA